MDTAAPTTPEARQREAVVRLAEHGGVAPWTVDGLPWDAGGAWDDATVPEAASLLARTGLLRGMRPRQRAHARRLEMASHLSALAHGEQCAVGLGAQTVLLVPEDAPEQRWFLGTLVADEAKHHLALERYLAEQLEARMTPHPALTALFAELGREGDLALNLLAGQVVLEGAAASLLNALLVGVRQPLLRELLRRVGRDEARHMRFAHLVAPPPVDGLSRARRRRMEEVLFEAAYAACAALVAHGAWGPLGLDPAAARAATVDALRERGAIAYFSRTVVRQLDLRGFPAETLGHALAGRLEDRLRRAA